VEERLSRPFPDPREILRIARSDRAVAEQVLSELSLDEQVAVVCEAPVAQRAALLELAPAPEKLIPLIPEAELCFTAKGVGLADAGWILEYATPDQVVASVDLDAWDGFTPDLRALDRWMAILAEAGEAPILRAMQSIDAELTVLYLIERIEVFLKPNDDESWQPPEASQTLEGQFYFRARGASDDIEPLLRALHTLFAKDYWLYFRLMQGVIWELKSELEEWASRWRSARLEDLGFPTWDAAMRIYGFIRPDQRADLDNEVAALDVQGWDLPVWLPQLPASADSQRLLFMTAAELTEDERRGFFYAFIALANKVAVADRLQLGEPETLPRAIEKAAEVASDGLEYIARENRMGAAEVLRHSSLERLFRVGASLTPDHLPLSPIDDR
jgi:hypothetical protein